MAWTTTGFTSALRDLEMTITRRLLHLSTVDCHTHARFAVTPSHALLSRPGAGGAAGPSWPAGGCWPKTCAGAAPRAALPRHAYSAKSWWGLRANVQSRLTALPNAAARLCAPGETGGRGLTPSPPAFCLQRVIHPATVPAMQPSAGTTSRTHNPRFCPRAPAFAEAGGPAEMGARDCCHAKPPGPACPTNIRLLPSPLRTWAAPSESLQGERRVPMEMLTRLLLAAAMLVLAVLALCLALA